MFVVTFRQVSLDTFWSQEPRTVNGKQKISKNLESMAREESGLVVFLPPFVSYPLKYEMGVGVACVIIRF